MIKNVCVFCSSSNHLSNDYHQAATLMGSLLAKNDFTLIFGGGGAGLMGGISRAVLENGGKVYGFMPEFLRVLEGSEIDIENLEIVETMHIRKQKMHDHADAFIVLPGGFGTLDELFETLGWRQLNLHQKPIVIVNTLGYWDPLKKLFDNVIDNNFASHEHRNYLIFVETPEEAIKYLKSV